MYRIEYYNRVWLISGRYRLRITCCLVSRLLKRSREGMIIMNEHINSNKYKNKDKVKAKDS